MNTQVEFPVGNSQPRDMANIFGLSVPRLRGTHCALVGAEVTHMAHANRTAARIERDAAVEDAVMALLNDAVAFRTSDTGRAELTCKMCGAHDENHTPDCPVPVLEQWVNPSEGRALIWS